MTKREFNNGFKYLYFEDPTNKFPKISTPEAEYPKKDHLSSLPTELIFKIISYLDDFDDVKNCLLISKYFRHLLLNDQKIMQKFSFFFDFQSKIIDYSCMKIFIQNSGSCIRNLQVEVSCKLTEIIMKIIESLHLMPNLEILWFEIEDPALYRSRRQFKQDNEDREEEILIIEHLLLYDRTPLHEIKTQANLPKLKKLNIRFQDLRHLFRKVKNLHNLEILNLTMKEFKNQCILIDMLNEFKNLKHLKITEKFNDEHIFSESQLSSLLDVPIDDKKLTIQLETFKTNARESDAELRKFLETQIDCLEELELEFEPHSDFNDLWPKFKKLKILSLENPSFDTTNHAVLETVKEYQTDIFENFAHQFKRFPNVEFLIINYIEDLVSGVFPNLHTLEIEYFDVSMIHNAQFPNLKTLIVTNCFDFENFSNLLWISFCKNIPNVETLKLNIFRQSACDICILDCLPILKNLKIFEYRHDLYGRMVNSFETKEVMLENDEFYKIYINTVRKVVKVCCFIVENDYKIMRKLCNNFSNFEFIEICIDKSENLSKFNPLIALQTRTRPERRVPHNKMFGKSTRICRTCYYSGCQCEFSDDSVMDYDDLVFKNSCPCRNRDTDDDDDDEEDYCSIM